MFDSTAYASNVCIKEPQRKHRQKLVCCYTKQNNYVKQNIIYFVR